MLTLPDKSRKPLPHMVKKCSRFPRASVQITSLAATVLALTPPLLRRRKTHPQGPHLSPASARRAHQLLWLRLILQRRPVLPLLLDHGCAHDGFGKPPG